MSQQVPLLELWSCSLISGDQMFLLLQEHSAEYWPKTSKSPLTFGKYLVKLESEHTAADIVTRSISVTNTQVCDE